MSTIMRGTVAFFDPMEDKMFGFILFNQGRNKAFFHYNKGSVVEQSMDGIRFIRMNVRRIPEVGDSIIFKCVQNNKIDSQCGFKAIYWAFDVNYHLARTEVSHHVYKMLRKIRSIPPSGK